jgi:hypothetical protein
VHRTCYSTCKLTRTFVLCIAAAALPLMPLQLQLVSKHVHSMSIRRSTLDTFDDNRTDIPDFKDEDIRSSRYIAYIIKSVSSCTVSCCYLCLFVLKYLIAPALVQSFNMYTRERKTVHALYIAKYCTSLQTRTEMYLTTLSTA